MRPYILFVLSVMFLFGCAVEDPPGDSSLTLEDMPPSLLSTLETLTSQVSTLQVQVNEADTNIATLEGRVDDLELTAEEYDLRLADIESAIEDGVHPPVFEVYSNSPVVCTTANNWDYISTGYFIDGPALIFYNNGTVMQGWYLALTVEEVTDCLYAQTSAQFLIANGELLYQANTHGAPPNWTVMKVAVLHLQE